MMASVATSQNWQKKKNNKNQRTKNYKITKSINWREKKNKEFDDMSK